MHHETFSPTHVSEYKHARAKMPERTHETLDRLRGEILMICKAHEVDHPLKLGREGKEPTTETLKRMHDLMQDMLFIFEHKELPENIEYVVPIESTNPIERIQIFHHDGRFLALDRSSTPHCLYDHRGKKKILSPGLDYQEFLFLGPQVVLSAIDVQKRRILTSLDGEVVLDDITWIRDTDRHIVFVGKGPSPQSGATFPVNEKGVVQWEDPFPICPQETVMIAGLHYFLIRDEKGWRIRTAEGVAEAFPGAYPHRPVLFEKDGELAVILFETSGRGDNGRYRIYDKNGQFLKKMETFFEIKKAVFIHGQYLFAGRTLSGAPILFKENYDKENEIMYEGEGDEDEIKDLRVDHGKLLFLTKIITTISHSLGGEEHDVSEVFCDENGEEIVNYEGHAPEQHPIAIAERFAFINFPPLETGTNEASITYRDREGNKTVLGTFEEVYALQAIDDHRFYAIVLEEKKRENFQGRGNFQVAKRIYDIRDRL